MKTHIQGCGPVIMAALQQFSREGDEPDDAQAAAAFAACRAAGRRMALVGHDLSDAGLSGVATMEAEGALLDLGIDPDDASPGLLAALAGEFAEAYRAC